MVHANKRKSLQECIWEIEQPLAPPLERSPIGRLPAQDVLPALDIQGHWHPSNFDMSYPSFVRDNELANQLLQRYLLTPAYGTCTSFWCYGEQPICEGVQSTQDDNTWRCGAFPWCFASTRRKSSFLVDLGVSSKDQFDERIFACERRNRACSVRLGRFRSSGATCRGWERCETVLLLRCVDTCVDELQCFYCVSFERVPLWVQFMSRILRRTSRKYLERT